jgi:phosphoribosyl-ATP pyrophosphohydrolase/phosphoribosyl-AMP cyclohydrolase/histidinol dehydrogenase
MTRVFGTRTPAELFEGRTGAFSAHAVEVAREIVADVRGGGDRALRRWAVHFGELEADDPVFLDRKAIASARDRIDDEARTRLERIAERIRVFADAQRRSVTDTVLQVPGGAAGSRFVPVERAGCYAPGGRYPLPSSVLMTVIPAAVAGVEEIWVASPRPSWEMLAAAAIGGATGVIAAGGAQAIAALAYGAGPVPPCDVVVGPGNVYVTAAKHLVTERVAIDMLAGPSELVIIADAHADAGLVAADLLAQAEHDTEAVPILVTTDRALIGQVEAELERQLETLPTAEVARRALTNGGAVVAADLEEAIRVSDRLAPEHVELHVEDAPALAPRLRHFGSLFVGADAAEVLGDYGAGPNHVLPTGGTARSVGGLSVLTFLRSQTWLRIDDPAQASAVAEDAAWCGRIEGLEAHARSAERRVSARSPGTSAP